MKVKFVPQDVEFDIQPGQSVMTLAHEKGIPIRSTCNGLPSCAECRVKVVDGDWNTNPPARKELGLIGTGYYIDQRRLSCQVLCFGDVTVDTSEQLEKASEGPVTKKFLTKVHKSSAQESHSKGGVLLVDDEKLMHELQRDVPVSHVQERPQHERDRGQGGGRDNRGGGQRHPHRDRHDRNRGGGGQRADGPRGEGAHGSGRDGHRAEGGGQGGGRDGGRRRRRRGGRGRGPGGGGGQSGSH